MEHLAKLLDILRARPGQLGGLALGSAAFAWLLVSPVMPPSAEGAFIWMAAALCVMCMSAGLVFGTAVEWAVGQIGRRLRRELIARRNRAVFRAYVPYLTPKERKILGYLLHHKQKTFEIAADGGHAGGLLARGFIQFRGVAGQAFDIDNRIAVVPDDVWVVMEELSSDFPYSPEIDGSGRNRVETHPWRVDWRTR